MPSKRTADVPKFPPSISEFCSMMEQAQKDYAWNYEQVNYLDRLTQDYLHQLELRDLRYKERAKIATQIAKCRQQRRACKDTVEILDPLIQFLESEKGKTLMNLTREVLGKTRKVEEKMQNRIYVPRVMDIAEYLQKKPS